MVSQIMQQNSQYYNEDTGKSKILLLLIEGLVGPLGFDRMYMGCFRSGIVKFLLPFIAISFMYVLPPLGTAILGGWVVWALVDYAIVMINALARWRTQPFTVGCGGQERYWKDEKEVQYGFYLAISLILFDLIVTYVVPRFVPMKTDQQGTISLE